jgi:hypothetical protein
MRKLFALVMVTGLVAAAGSANAVTSISIQGLGTPLTVGSSRTFDLVLTNDVDLITFTFIVGISSGTLDITGGTNTPLPGGAAPVAFSINAPDGPAATYGGLINVGSLAPGTYTVGTITVLGQAAGAGTLTPDQRVGVDEWYDVNINVVDVVHNGLSLTVVPIPEPGTASLLGLGLLGLVLAGRRATRS